MSDTKVVAITGASSGIGQATARLLAEHGHAVVLGARRKDTLAALATELNDAGGRADYHVVDVTRRARSNVSAGSTRSSTMPALARSRASTRCASTIGTP